MAPLTMLQNINLTVFIRRKFISSKVLRGSYQFVLYTLVTAIVFFLDLAFHVYFCKSFLNSQTKAMVRAKCNREQGLVVQGPKQKRYFLFSRQWHGIHSDLTSLSSTSSKSVLNYKRIVFSCRWRTKNRNVKS